jgi:predicted Rossmann-fold nucleotide-binding protein
LIDWFRNTLVTEGTISADDLELFQIIDSPREVVDAIFDYYEHKSFEPSEQEQEKLLEL